MIGIIRSKLNSSNSTRSIDIKKNSKRRLKNMSKTEDFLKEAFAGESQVNRKYQAFAAKADKEGYIQVAKLFRAASEAEAVHANNHLRVMKGVLSTPENLKAAISGEDHELSLIH